MAVLPFPYLGPGKPGRHANQIFALHLTIPVARNARKLIQIAAGDADRCFVSRGEFLDRLPCQIGQFALEVTDARFAGVKPHKVPQCVIGNRPFSLL